MSLSLACAQVEVPNLDGTTGAGMLLAEILAADTGGEGDSGSTSTRVSRYLYTACFGSSQVSGFRIDQGDGSLTSINTLSAGSSSPSAVTADSGGRYLYVSGSGENFIHQYTIDRETGTLGANGSVASGNSPRAHTAHPSADFLYVSNEAANTVSHFSIGGTGLLSSLGTAPVGANSRYITIHPDALALYAGNFGDADITPILIASGTGTLTSQTDIAVDVEGVVSHPHGSYLYGPAGTMGVMRMNLDGSGIPSANGTAVGGQANYLAVNKAGNYSYVATSPGNTVQAHSINGDGSFTVLGSAQSVGSGPRAIAVTEDGRFVYTANFSGSVSLLRVAADGTLTPGGDTAACTQPNAITIVTYTE